MARDKSKPPEIESGLYKSHKKKLYRITGEVSLNSTNRAPEGEWLVEYYDEPVKYIGDMALKYSREYNEFIESVPDPDNPGQVVKRFQKIDE